MGIPQRLPIRRRALHASGDDVWLFTGCVMDAWQRDIHLATQEVIEATGTTVRPTGDAAPCCGALHTHAGLGNDARKLAARVISALDGDNAILVNSAGCGAALKDYGRLLDNDEARAFSARVFDIHEWLAAHIDELTATGAESQISGRVAVQDPCHLRHVQGSHLAVRRVLEPFVEELVELDDEGMCCGAGGAYSLVHRQLALDVRARKTRSHQPIRCRPGGERQPWMFHAPRSRGPHRPPPHRTDRRSSQGALGLGVNDRAGATTGP